MRALRCGSASFVACAGNREVAMCDGGAGAGLCARLTCGRGKIRGGRRES